MKNSKPTTTSSRSILMVCIFVFVTSLFSITKLKGQTLPEMIDFKVHCSKDSKNAKGAIVTVFKNTYIKMDEKTTGITGRVSFDLPFGYDYKVVCKYENCADVFMEVKGSTIPRDRTDIFPMFKTEAVFFEKNDTLVNVDLYAKNPYEKAIWDGRESMKDDKPYQDWFTKKMILTEEERKTRRVQK